MNFFSFTVKRHVLANLGSIFDLSPLVNLCMRGIPVREEEDANLGDSGFSGFGTRVSSINPRVRWLVFLALNPKILRARLASVVLLNFHTCSFFFFFLIIN
jgi:hypothetical protein